MGNRKSYSITALTRSGEQKLYQELRFIRFVLVEINGIQSVLAGTSLELESLSIIRLYSYRFRIECVFRELRQPIGAFCYHFWSKHMPKISYYQKAGEPGLLEQVEKRTRYQRPPSRGRVSEAALILHLRKYIFLFMEKEPDLRITQITREQKDTSKTY